MREWAVQILTSCCLSLFLSALPLLRRTDAGLTRHVQPNYFRSAFTKDAKGEQAHTNAMKVSKGLAAVALRVLQDPSFAATATKEYEEHRKLK